MAVCLALHLHDVAEKGEAPPTEHRGTHDNLAQKEEPKDWGYWGVCLDRNSEVVDTVKRHFTLKAQRRGSVGGAGSPSYLLSPRSRVLSFMRAVRAYPRVAGRDIWDCSTLSSNANTSSSSTFAGGRGHR